MASPITSTRLPDYCIEDLVNTSHGRALIAYIDGCHDSSYRDLNVCG